MNLPRESDYIDIHVHRGHPIEGVYILESLMAHEGLLPGDVPGKGYTFGIHPWFLNEENYTQHLELTRQIANDPFVIAIGEAGFDKLKGPSLELQRKVFMRQVELSESLRKPLIIHCVRAWEELLSVHKEMRPQMPWMIHGFRGKIKLAEQLLSKGFFLSLWFEFVLKPESSDLIRALPQKKIFLETDGADVDIRSIYLKVSDDLELTVIDLKTAIYSNFIDFFNI
jgi:TatD DNase family protein